MTGKGSEYSDIDIGISGKIPVPSDILSKIKDDIDNLSILYTIDIVDFNTTSVDFRKVAMKQIEYIYE